MVLEVGTCFQTRLRNANIVWFQVRNAHKIARKPEGKVSLGGQNCRWWDIIKIDHKQFVCVDTDWFKMTQHKVQWQTLTLVNKTKNL
jgi:hypothetical protein